MLARIIFGLVDFAARKGLAPEAKASAQFAADRRQTEELQSDTAVGESQRAAKERARRTGVSGETYAYWYLRRHGYVFVARNYTAPGIKGEIDLIGYDGPVLAFVEVKTRTADEQGELLGKPEDAVNADKRRALARMARQFLAERGMSEAQCRFDVVGIESRAGTRPVVRLHKAAF